MRISAFIIFLVVAGGIIYVFSTGANELNANYNSSYVDITNKSESLDFSNQINSSVGKLKDKFDQIQDVDNGFFTKISAGIGAIPYAVILIPAVAIDSLSLGGTMITDFFTAVGIPQKIILLAILVMIIWGIFKLAEGFSGSKL